VSVHERVIETMAARRDGQVSWRAAARADRHLAACGDCRRVAAGLDSVDLFARDLAVALTPADRPAWEPSLRALTARPVARTEPRQWQRPGQPGPHRPKRPVPTGRLARALPAAIAVAVLLALVLPALWLRSARQGEGPAIDQPSAPPSTTLAPTSERRAAAERTARAFLTALNRDDAEAAWALLSPSARVANKSPGWMLQEFQSRRILTLPESNYRAVRIPTDDGQLRWAVFVTSSYDPYSSSLPVVSVVGTAGRPMIDEHPEGATGLSAELELTSDGTPPPRYPVPAPRRLTWRIVPTEAVRGQLVKPRGLTPADLRSAWIALDGRVLRAEVRLSATLWRDPCCQTLDATVTGLGRVSPGLHQSTLVLIDRSGRMQSVTSQFSVR
jgi:Putative zinc-finger